MAASLYGKGSLLATRVPCSIHECLKELCLGKESSCGFLRVPITGLVLSEWAAISVTWPSEAPALVSQVKRRPDQLVGVLGNSMIFWSIKDCVYDIHCVSTLAVSFSWKAEDDQDLKFKSQKLCIVATRKMSHSPKLLLENETSVPISLNVQHTHSAACVFLRTSKVCMCIHSHFTSMEKLLITMCCAKDFICIDSFYPSHSNPMNLGGPWTCPSWTMVNWALNSTPLNAKL